MPTLNFLFIKSVQIMVLASCLPIFAQSEPGQWVGEHYMVKIGIGTDSEQYVLIDEKNSVQKIMPSLRDATDFPIPSQYLNYFGSMSSFWYQDAFHVLAIGAGGKNDDGSLFLRLTFAKLQDDVWQYLGSMKISSGMFRAIPCENGRFIVVSKEDPTGNRGPDRTPFARGSIIGDKREFKIDAPIAHGQDELMKYMSNPEVFSLAGLSWAIMTPKHVTLLNPKTGLFWVFSLEKASLVKSGNIFGKVTPEMVAKGGFPNPILCVNPEKDGTVLIAAQDEDFFITDSEDIQKKMLEMFNADPRPSMEEMQKMVPKIIEESANRNPYIVWYRIHPENGRVEKLSHPPEGGSNVREGGKNDRWRPMPDGSVKVIGWLENEIEKSLETKTKKATEKKAEENALKKEGQAVTESQKTNKGAADAKKSDLAAK